MAKITKQSENFSKWYTDVILDADLADYGPVKGTMVVKPYGFSLWTHIRDSLNEMIEESGHENAYFPYRNAYFPYENTYFPYKNIYFPNKNNYFPYKNAY